MSLLWYRLKLGALKPKPSSFLERLVGRFYWKLNSLMRFHSNVPEHTSLRLSLIERYAPGKSFADIGCLWGVHGFYSFFAEEHGATSVAAVDVYPASEEFERERARRRSKIDFIQGDINRQETIDRIGPRDVVFCSGLLYHVPNPVHTLSRLRLICNEVLILGSQTIPEFPVARNVAVFYPYLDAGQRQLWDVSDGAGRGYGLARPYDVSQGYGNWFWGFTPSCLDAMLRCAGFEVIEGDAYVTPFDSCFVCRARPIGFLPVSGDWSAPEASACDGSDEQAGEGG